METDNVLYKVNIDSGIGQFELRVNSTNQLQKTEFQNFATILTSTSYQIIIKHTVAPVGWLPTHMSVDTAEAWLFYIIKLNDEPEQLNISFCLTDMLPQVQTGPDTGENLTAIEFEDGVRQIHIGTHDEEAFARRSENIWMPKRLISLLEEGELIITDITIDGLVTQVPELLRNEGFYVHYILAESPRRKSIDYPGDWDVSTWFAVDQSKKTLEESWQSREM